MASLDSLSKILDPLPLECDGMIRCASMVLRELEIDHEVRIGTLRVHGVGHIGWHAYLVLPSGEHFDLRARMWMGEDKRVPHGVFIPTDDHEYQGQPVELAGSPLVFMILSGLSFDAVVQEVRNTIAERHDAPRA